MKLLSMFVAMVCLLVSSANAEVNMVDQGAKDSYYGNFLVSYDAESQTYWTMIHVVKSFAGITIGHDYRVYRLSHDFTDISLEFETKHSIYSMIATSEGLVFEREIFFNYTSSEVYYYNIQNKTNKRCVPLNVNSLCGLIDNFPLYYRHDVGLCLYNSTSNSETVLIRGQITRIINLDDECCVYQTEDGSIFTFLFQTGASIPAVLPDHISRISNGYLLDRENMLLYGPDNSVTSVPFIAGANSISMRDGFLCALDSSSDTNTLNYISLNQPEKVTSVTLPTLLDRNLNIHNGYAFFYTKHASEISVVNLSTNTVETIILPR